MPRYFIDSSDGDLQVIDAEGLDLASVQEARRAALGALPDMAHDLIPDGDQRSFTVSVRDETGAVIYSATFTLEGHWHDICPSPCESTR